MSVIEEQIEVDGPLRTAYDQWTQFEEFPRFMEGVDSITQTDDTHLHWVAKIGGVTREWDAEVTEQIPDERVAWASVDGAANTGIVTFERIDETTTRVDVEMEVEPEGAVESAGAAMGFVGRSVKDDLKRFKEFIEARGQETGAWRGKVGVQ